VSHCLLPDHCPLPSIFKPDSFQRLRAGACMYVAECRRDIGLVVKLGICPGWSSPVSWDERLADVPQKYGLLRSQGTIHEMPNWNRKSPKGIPHGIPGRRHKEKGSEKQRVDRWGAVRRDRALDQPRYHTCGRLTGDSSTTQTGSQPCLPVQRGSDSDSHRREAEQVLHAEHKQQQMLTVPVVMVMRS
jgi:hypothetical protein